MTFKSSIYYNNSYNALTIPRYSRVGERCADGETKTLELNTPKNSPLEDRVHGAIPNLFILVKEASKHKKSRFIETYWKEIWNKIVIRTEMCMTKT